MNDQPVYVGLDYHQDAVQVCVVNGSGQVLANRRCANRWQAIVEAASSAGATERAAIESSCGAADLAQELIEQGGWSVELAHPGYVQRMKGSPDKTDWSDARLLADLTRVGYLPKVWLAPEVIRELRRLVRYRQQLVDQRRALKLRVRGLLRDHRIAGPGIRPWTKGWLKWLCDLRLNGEQSRWILDQHLHRLERLNQEVSQIDQRLAHSTRDDRMVIHLLEQPGVGPVTALMIRAEIGRFDRFASGKQLCRFCGLSPRNASSGQRQADAGLIKAGSKRLRAVLIEAAWRLMAHDQRWSALAQQMHRRGKPKSVIAAAIANRWMRWLFHQMRPFGLAA